jgi:hypothetical protein
MTPILMALLACGPGPVDLSTVTDTRVLSIVGEPPEVYPGERTTITVTVADPLERGLEVMTCVPWEGACLETEVGVSLPFQVAISPLIDGEVSSTRQVPNIPATLPSALMDEEIPDWVPVQVWALACPVNECGVINEARAALRASPLGPVRGQPWFFQPQSGSGEQANTSLAAALYDPTTWMDSLPLEGIGLSTKTLRIARPDREDRNHNPYYEARFLAASGERLAVDRGTVFELAFFVDDADGDKVYAHGYTTLGAFEARRAKVEDDAVRLYLIAPDSPGDGQVWVVMEDEAGGAAVWTMPLRIR